MIFISVTTGGGPAEVFDRLDGKAGQEQTTQPPSLQVRGYAHKAGHREESIRHPEEH